MKEIVKLVLFLLLLFQCIAVMADDFELDCKTTDREVPSMLKYAPSGAKRINPYSLQVNWKKGSALFTDPVPFDPEGATWSYCGYSKKAKFHLIQHIDGDFSGELLNETTGRIIEAGDHVVISPDLKYYFASRQPDGLDGEEWEVFSIEGVSVWKGFSFIEDPDQVGQELANLSWPTWNDQGKLESSYQCLSASNDSLERNIPLPDETTVTLEAVKGVYAWTPKAKCAKKDHE